MMIYLSKLFKIRDCPEEFVKLPEGSTGEILSQKPSRNGPFTTTRSPREAGHVGQTVSRSRHDVKGTQQLGLNG